jgi:hypothetical protein
VLGGVEDIVSSIINSIPTAIAIPDIALPTITGLPSVTDLASATAPLESALAPVLGGVEDIASSIVSSIPTPTLPSIDIPSVLPTSLPKPELIFDTITGFLRNPLTGAYFSAETGVQLKIDAGTGFPIDPIAGLPVNTSTGQFVLPSLPSPPVALPLPPVVAPTVPLPPVVKPTVPLPPVVKPTIPLPPVVKPTVPWLPANPFASIIDEVKKSLINKISQGHQLTSEDANKLLLALLKNERGGILQTGNHYYADANSLQSVENTLLLGWKRPASKTT